MEHIVTASIGSPVSIRKMASKPSIKKVISSGFTDSVMGGSRIYSFTTNFKDEVDLEIDNIKTFDLTNRVDKHNWDTLKIYKKLNPADASVITLFDPQEEVNKARVLADKAFEVESFIRKNELDESKIAKMYRRLIGSASGLSAGVIFKKLLDLAKTQPDLFMTADGFFVDAPGYENLALLDLAIEKQFVILDVGNGQIKKDSGTIYAKDIESAAFQLNDDVEYRTYLQRAVAGNLQVAKKVTNATIIEDSEFVLLSNAVGKSISGNSVEEYSDSGPIRIGNDSEVDEVVEKAIKSGLIARTGAGTATRYSLQGVDGSYSKNDFKTFMHNNPSQFMLLKEMAKIE